MSEPSLQRRLFSCKLMIYLNLLLLWNSGSECSSDLPDNEVSSLITLTRQFKSKVSYTFTSSYCLNQINNYGVSFKCTQDCTINPKIDCHIVEIVLSTMQLSGTIDAAIGDLQSLYRIVLSNNKLQGPIPASLGNLLKLDTLDLSNNQLTGTIPESLGNLVNLQYLYLQNNYLEGSIPSSLGLLESLRYLQLAFNKLSGSVPEELGFLYNLSTLDLAENKLTGSFPNTLGNLNNLVSFWVPSNYFTGTLPDTFSNFTKLRWFGVAGNDLHGPLPLYVKNWNQIESLVFQGNNFDGNLPAEYFTLSTLQHLYVTDLNTFPFRLPESQNISRIYTLVLRNCSIVGSIPKYIGELSSLKHLDLSFNSLTGGVPESMRPNLIYMSLARNKLNGTIPNWIFQATQTRLDLSYNNFAEMQSPVPTGLPLNLFACCCCQSSESTEPYMLQPDQMMNAYNPGKPKFYSLYINSGGGETTFNGKTYEADNETSPFHVSSVRNWAYSFSGDFVVATANSSDYIKNVPCKISNSETSLYDEARLSPVSLTYLGFSLYKGIYNVTLHFAEIVYVDDADYNGLRKRLFDIYIQGKRVLPNFDIRRKAGGPNTAITMNFTAEVLNDSLLTIHLFWAGRGSFFETPAFNGPLISAISVNPTFDVSSEKLSPLNIALISVASLAFALLLFLAFAWYMGWLEDKELLEEIEIGELINRADLTSQPNEEENNNKVTLKKLVKATGKFSESGGNMLGKGRLGTVYKAPLDQKNVAVKKLFPHLKGKALLIKQEIYNLKSLEHENLLKLWDFHAGRRLQLLVYEYMEKKSLESFFSDSKTLDVHWKDRFKICQGIARGLEFLHKRPRFMSIVHGNIKASNILLDENFQPKLSDFGLTNVCTDEDQYYIIKKEAPEGYLAPEYLRLKNPTMETDIYSFGVLLLEMVCGVKNKQAKAIQESDDLLDKAHKYYKSGNKRSLESMIDRKLESDGDEDKQALDVLNLAVMCTDISPSCRPNISHIVSVLTGKKSIDEIRQAIDASNIKHSGFADAKNGADKNEDSKSKEETASSPSTSNY